MAKTVWTDAQIIAQMDSGAHWSGSTITYGFPTTAAWFPYGEKTGFTPLTLNQQLTANLAIKLWDDLISPTITRAANPLGADIKYSNTTTNIGYAQAYFPDSGSAGGSVWFNPNYGTNLGHQQSGHPGHRPVGVPGLRPRNRTRPRTRSSGHLQRRLADLCERCAVHAGFAAIHDHVLFRCLQHRLGLGREQQQEVFRSNSHDGRHRGDPVDLWRRYDHPHRRHDLRLPLQYRRRFAVRLHQEPASNPLHL